MTDAQYLALELDSLPSSLSLPSLDDRPLPLSPSLSRPLFSGSISRADKKVSFVIAPENVRLSEIKRGKVKAGTMQYCTIQSRILKFITVEYSAGRRKTYQFSTLRFSTVHYVTS